MDNFDLKKFLKENKAIENLNPTFKSLNENESREERADVDKYEYEKGKKAGKREAMKKKIKEMIVAELDGAAVEAEDYDPVYEGDPEEDREKDEAYIEGGFGSFEEAKKKKKGKKDACYYKARAKYKVWPSAYASGYLVKCRKKKGRIKEEIDEELEIDEILLEDLAEEIELDEQELLEIAEETLDEKKKRKRKTDFSKEKKH